jgi:hypothetical protein
MTTTSRSMVRRRSAFQLLSMTSPSVSPALNGPRGSSIACDSFRLRASRPTSNSTTASNSSLPRGGGLGSTQRRQVEKLFREARVVLCEQFIEPKTLEMQ